VRLISATDDVTIRQPTQTIPEAIKTSVKPFVYLGCVGLLHAQGSKKDA
jgi:hypothetical protein